MYLCLSQGWVSRKTQLSHSDEQTEIVTERREKKQTNLSKENKQKKQTKLVKEKPQPLTCFFKQLT